MIMLRGVGTYTHPPTQPTNYSTSIPTTHPTTPTPQPTNQQHVADLIDEHLAHADDVRPPLARLFRLEEQLAPVRRQLRLDRMGPLVGGGGGKLEEEEEEMEEEEEEERRGRGGGGAGVAGVGAARRVSPRTRS